MTDPHGVCVALCTPFDESGERLDEGKLTRHIDEMIEAGVHGLVLCAGTGEFAYLRDAEKAHIAELGLRHVDGRVPVIVQTSAINTVDAIDKARAAQDLGADAVMVLPPYFEGPGERGVLYHYEKVAKAISIPIVLYNIPVHTGFDITPDLYRRLIAIENIEYIKDSTADLVRLQKYVAIGGKVLSGADPLQPYALMAGCHGWIWGGANVMPHEAVRLHDLLRAGDHAAALDLWRAMLPANLFFWENGYGTEYNVAVKTAARLVGRDLGPCRKPSLPMTGPARMALQMALARLPHNRARHDRMIWRDWLAERDWLVQMSMRS